MNLGLSRRGTAMRTSARDQLSGTVTIGAVMAEAVVDVGGQQVAAAITKDSAEKLGLAEGARSRRSSRPPT
jgi:molybdopterin-binding protein